MGIIGRFFDANRRVRHWMERRLPDRFVRSFNVRYVETVSAYLNEARQPVVVDIGAGKESHFIDRISEDVAPRLVGVDIDPAEIAVNPDLDLKVVCDVAQSRVFAEQSVDFLVSRSVVEHLHDNAACIRSAGEILKPGGMFIHLFPGRYAPFAIINRLLPDAVARRILYFFHPQFREPCGFKPYYDRCYYSAMKSMLEENGFEVVAIERRYYQSLYLDFFAPFFLIGLLYDYLAYLSGIPNLASQLLVIARKK